MQPFVTVTGVAAPLPRANVDTDQIMPKQFLKGIDRSGLAEGFLFDGVRVPLLSPQGIFKPQVMSEVPLSITTAPQGPYDDSFGADPFVTIL